MILDVTKSQTRIANHISPADFPPICTYLAMGKAKPKPKTKHAHKKGGKVKGRQGTKQKKRDEELVDEIEEPTKLYKSPSLNAYMTIALASIINYHAAEVSSEPINKRLVPASQLQRSYAKVVSLCSAIITCVLVFIHLDRWILTSFWIKTFGKKQSCFELAIILFLMFWWFIATIIQTGVTGIAGDGKEQYNLYYSNWVCLLATFWLLERKMIDFDMATIRGFITSWPYRAPGWICVFISSFFTLFWYVDLFVNTYQNRDDLQDYLRLLWEDINKSQYLWLLFVAAITLLPSAIFIFLEIVRDSSNDIKGSLETVAEGFCLALLTLSWIPSVIIVTTPGGFASQTGNAYFWTWGTTLFVMETFLWFIHDSRGNVQRAILEKEKEYKKHQEQVLQESQEKLRLNSETADNGRSISDGQAMIDPDESSELRSDDGSATGNRNLQPLDSGRMHDDDEEDSVEREHKMKVTNKKAYFNSLDDILE